MQIPLLNSLVFKMPPSLHTVELERNLNCELFVKRLTSDQSFLTHSFLLLSVYLPSVSTRNLPCSGSHLRFPAVETENLMRCAKGIFAKGIWRCARFPLLRWEKGSETPYCNGEKESETPSFLMVRPRERGSLRPFSPPQEGVSDPCPTAKGKTPYIPKSP